MDRACRIPRAHTGRERLAAACAEGIDLEGRLSPVLDDSALGCRQEFLFRAWEGIVEEECLLLSK